MEPQEKLTTQQFIIDRLHDIQRKAEANNYADALALMKEVKTADIKNIYLIALEKQIAKLTDTSLQPENRTEIIKSLPAMIERAINDVQRRSAAPKTDEVQKNQKEAALEKLKSQYFQRADDYVEKQEYTRALEEIRRIYIIEPGSVVAKEYEQKIEQLAALHARGEVQPVEPSKEAATASPEPPKEKYVLEEEPRKSKLPYIAAAAVVVLAVVGWFLFSPNEQPIPKSTEEGLSQPQTLTQESEAQTPSLPTTTTSTPQYSEEETTSKKSTEPEVTKQPTRAQKSQPEVKQTTPEAKPVQAPVKQQTTIQQQTRPQPQPVQQSTQPATQQQATQTVAEPPPQQQPPQEQPKVAESTPAPMPFVAIESPPELVRRQPAQYPEIAIKMGIQGKVFVEVTVDAQGKPIQAKVVKTSSDIFDESAVEAAMKSTYKPAMMSTGPVTAKVVVPFVYNIKR
jgi:protein TonB